MTRLSHLLLALAAAAAVLLPATAAYPQYYGAPSPAPLYPYAVQPGQPYAIEVAPNTYVIQRPGETRGARDTGSVRRGNVIVRAEPQPSPPRFDRPPRPNDPALIEELKKRHGVKREVVHTKKIVREKPVVIETKRYVDDPPRVIERYVDENGAEIAPPRAQPRRNKQAAIVEERQPKRAPREETKRAPREEGKRVIEADAEVTILGPDRMSIRLFRKGQRGANAKASVE
ncbi:MAG: hypothetical protein ACK4UO_13140 [Pseudolabrys sp.]